MVEAKFQFRATGDVDVSELQVDYGEVAPSEEWCNTPYVVKLNDPSDTLYELRFPLSPFNIPENGKLVRTCTVYGPIYVIPKLSIPILDVSLTIRQIACLDKLKCSDLIDQIDVFINTDEDFIHPDGGTLEVEREGYEPFFVENLVSIIDKETGSACTWASFDSEGNVFVSRRPFDALGTSQRRAEITYSYTYVYDGEIDDTSCHLEYTGEIIQRARTCEEADVEIEEVNTEYYKDDDRARNLGDILRLSGLDANAYAISGINDIMVSGPAFADVSRPVKWSDSRGDYVITVGSHSSTVSNLLEDKIGYILVKYYNKYLPGCYYESDTTVRVHGITCPELLEHVTIAIRLNDEGEYITSDVVNITSQATRFTVYISGDTYADYFTIDETKTQKDSRAILIDEFTFEIPQNTDEFSGKTYEFTFNIGIINEEYADLFVFGCNKDKLFRFVQEAYQEISDIGTIAETHDEVCESIEHVPSESLEYGQECGSVSMITNNDFIDEQTCTDIEPINSSDNFGMDCVSIGNFDEGLNTPTINETCE